jgi:hypothetical protein
LTKIYQHSLNENDSECSAILEWQRCKTKLNLAEIVSLANLSQISIRYTSVIECITTFFKQPIQIAQYMKACSIFKYSIELVF